MSDMVELNTRGSVGVIAVDNPPVNATSQGVRQGLLDCLARAQQDSSIDAIVIVGKGRTFVAGGDIREFGLPQQPPNLPEVIAALERCAKPVIAALHGSALGGGLEIALACNYRIAQKSTKCGFPEVKLGLIPGSGGTQRATRVMGVKAAADLITGGEAIAAEKAQQAGLIDKIIEGDVLEAACAWAKELAAVRPLPRVSQLSAKIEEDKRRPEVFAELEKSLAAKSRGFEAPLLCLESIRAAVELPFEQGVAKEREIFLRCRGSEQSAALRHVFFAEREVAKIPDVPKDTPLLPIETAGVIGAGTMGAGISMCFANAGIGVTLLEQSQELLDKGHGNIEKNYASSVKKGRLAQLEMDKRIGLIKPTLDYASLASVDLVVEAVFEQMSIKQEIFAKLDQACRPEAILATNTSNLNINQIASATSRPEQVIGLHFFSPAQIMRLLEVVRGARTSPQVIATSMALGRQLGKIAVLVGVCHGFVGNRILGKYRREAFYLVEEGASPQQVDAVITGFGFPMGPYAAADMAGLDIGYAGRKAQGKPVGERYSGTVADRLAEQGRLGQKAGRGFYRYEKGSYTPIPDPEVDKLIEETAREFGIRRRPISDQEILKRCIYPMINEGARILEEGIALRPGDIDIVWINGYGFPSYRGGPMHYGDTVGLRNVYDEMRKLREIHGSVWETAPLLKRLAEEGKSFADLPLPG